MAETDGAGNSKHIAALLSRHPRGNERAAVDRTLYHQYPERGSGDQTVSGGETPGFWQRPHREFGEDGPTATGDIVEQAAIISRIVVVDTAAEIGKCAPSGFQCAFVGFRIHATGTTGDNGKSMPSQFPSKLFCKSQAVVGCPARTDDCDTELIFRHKLTTD